MTLGDPETAAVGDADSALPQHPADQSLVANPRRRWRRWTAATVLLAVIVLLIVALATHPFRQTTPAATNATGNQTAMSLTVVRRRNLSAQTQVDATLGYAGTYTAINQARGTITALPAAGRVAHQGQVLYRVNGEPVVLLYGSTPAYRSLSAGASASDVSGRDVQELNTDLVTLGYATPTEITPGSNEFTTWTTAALDKLQKKLGVTETGTLDLGQAVFLPTAARIATVSATLGAPAQPGQPVLSATSTTRRVSIALDADQQSEVTTGDKVTITLPNNHTTPGVVTSVGTVATAPASGSADESATIPVTVTLRHPKTAGRLDQAPVTVSITTGVARHALVVPVDALLALAGGGYAVEVVTTEGSHHLVAVTPGLFDDAHGLVQVSGSALTARQHVVVPSP